MNLPGILTFLLVFATWVTAADVTRAQCTNPAGVAGEEFYNFSDKVFQYCNGDDWVAMICNNENDIEPVDCSLPWGGTILHNASIMAYQNATEPFGSSCASESRTCNNGALSGSYVNQNCSVSPPADCTAPWGATVSHGSDVLAYQNATEPFGGSCTSETRTCNNGALAGAYTSENCTVTPPADCTPPWGGTVTHGNDITAYLNADEPFGGSCMSQTRSCNNGTLSGAYTNESCSVSTDPCDGSPTPGDTCADGSVYAGLSPDGNVPMYTTPADFGYLRWNNGSAAMTNTGVTSLTGGASNTAVLESLLDSNSPYEAAQACSDLIAFGSDDWYLPARAELDVLFQNKDAIGGFDTSGHAFNGYYWTSSEQDASILYAWSQRFNDGALHHSSGKNTVRSVRCVRKDGVPPPPPTDPCASNPSPGAQCADGTVYAGEFGGASLFTTVSDQGQFSWINENGNYTTTNAISLNDGLSNTNLLVSLSDSGAPYRAAQACRALGADWYLPSRDELNLLYTHSNAIGGFNKSGSYPAGFYWSSSESPNNGASWAQRFFDGFQNYSGKIDVLSVRCVRR